MMKKKDKVILYSVFIVPVVLLFGFGLWTFIFGKGVEETIRKADFEENFRGTVDSLFVDGQDHGTKKAVLTNKYIFPMPAIWERYIECGDSLLKTKNSYKIYIYSHNKQKIVLDYRNTYKKK